MAALDALEGRGTEPRFIRSLLERIHPGLEKLPDSVQGDDRVQAAVEANVRWTIKQLKALPETQQRLTHKEVLGAGAVYELKTGAVRFLED